MKKQLQVASVYPERWNSRFTVYSENKKGNVEIEAKIQTVDVYTHKCLKCNTVDSCNHTNAIKEYIRKEVNEGYMKWKTENESLDNKK